MELLWYRIGFERAIHVAIFVSKFIAIIGMILGFTGYWGGQWIGVLSIMVFFQSTEQAVAMAAAAIIQPFSLKERLMRKVRKTHFFGVLEKNTMASPTNFHHCKICNRTEVSNPELTFRVARDGEEYCSDHLAQRGAGV